MAARPRPIAALTPVKAHTRTHEEVSGPWAARAAPPVDLRVLPDPTDPKLRARVRHWQKVARRSTATYGAYAPWPRCSICTGPLVLGQVGAHGLCRAFKDPDDDPRNGDNTDAQ